MMKHAALTKLCRDYINNGQSLHGYVVKNGKIGKLAGKYTLRFHNP